MDEYELAELKGREIVEELLVQTGITLINYTTERRAKNDGFFINKNRELIGFEVKNRRAEINKYYKNFYLEKTKYDYMDFLNKGITQDNLYINIFDDVVYIFSFNAIKKKIEKGELSVVNVLLPRGNVENREEYKYKECYALPKEWGHKYLKKDKWIKIN